MGVCNFCLSYHFLPFSCNFFLNGSCFDSFFEVSSSQASGLQG